MLLQTADSVLDSCQSVDPLRSWRFENYQYSHQVTIQSQVLHLHWVFTEGKIRRELLVVRRLRYQETSHSYRLYSSDIFQHPLRPTAIAEIPYCDGSDCDLIAVNIPRCWCLSLSAGLIFSDIRAWVMLANWKSMSDVTNMCRYKVDIYQSGGPQNQPQPPGQEPDRNRKIKLVFLFLFTIFIFDLMFSYCRKIWHIAGDVTANQHIYVFRNIIM